MKRLRKQIKKVANLLLLAFFILAVPKAHNHYLRTLAHLYTTPLIGILGGGTGFQIVTPTGQKYLVTNKHVCQAAFITPFMLAEADGQFHRILYQAPENDICLLEPMKRPGGLLLGFNPILGQEINVLGYPELAPLHLSKGEVIARYKDLEQHKQFYQFDSFYISAQVLPGNSGSPVLNGFGQVVGILWGGRNDIFWGLTVPVSDLKKVIVNYEEAKDKAFKYKKLLQMRRNLQ